MVLMTENRNSCRIPASKVCMISTTSTKSYVIVLQARPDTSQLDTQYVTETVLRHCITGSYIGVATSCLNYGMLLVIITDSLYYAWCNVKVYQPSAIKYFTMSSSYDGSLKITSYQSVKPVYAQSCHHFSK